MCCTLGANISIIRNDCKDLPNILVDSIQKYGYSLLVIQEIVLTLKYYTQMVEAIPSMHLENLQMLVNLHRESKNEKIKNNVHTILLQCSKIMEYEDHLNKIYPGWN